MTLYDKLAPHKDEAYRSFQLKLVPNIPPETMLGVRTPALRPGLRRSGGRIPPCPP